MTVAAPDLQDRERRKLLRLRIRADLHITPQRYEGRTYYVVKDPVGMQYFRLREQEHFLIRLMDGTTTLEDARNQYEKRFRPERLKLEELEAFAQQIMTSGLARNDSPQLGRQLLERSRKRRRREWFYQLSNILAIRIPIFDPDRLLTGMLVHLRWIFTLAFLGVSVVVLASALLLVATHFEAFRARLPDYHEFFNPRNLLVMWLTLGVVKVIHEFGHGLSCKAFGGEVHEMGALLLCFSPCLYCNVSDAWTMPGKWRRIIIAAAGIYVELMIAALATFVWWNSDHGQFIHQIALSLAVVCSVSTVIFNGNPLMRFDGYHVLADWLEIPNLSHRANRFLMQRVQEHCLGMEVAPEPPMADWRKVLFVTYAVTSYVYRWVITFGVLWFFVQFLKPYKLGALGGVLAVVSLVSMTGMPLFRLHDLLEKRGRLPDMKQARVAVSLCVLALLLLGFFLVPLPVSRVRQTGLIQADPEAMVRVHVPVPAGGERQPGMLEQIHIQDGEEVAEGQVLAEFRNLELEQTLAQTETQLGLERAQLRAAQDRLNATKDENERAKYRAEIARKRGEQDRLFAKVNEYRGMRAELVLRAPQAGVVMSPPRTDEIGRMWDRERTAPFCSIRTPGRLRVLVPVSTTNYRLLKEDLRILNKQGRTLEIEVRVPGRGTRTWKGRVAQFPQSDAREIPRPLTDRAGGPIAIRPTSDSKNSDVAVPQSQQYLVPVDILDPDNAICPGTLAQVKIHCRWRSAAWWTWRTLSSTFDIGLL